MSLSVISTLLGGLAIFLVGLKQMEDGLLRLTGGYFKQLLNILTKNRVVGFLVGIILTTLLQSSTATTLMIIGFISTGFITLTQALGFILGANIGSTTTGQIMSLSFSIDQYALLILAFGALLYLFSPREREKVKNTGLTLLGLGMLFYGLLTMKQAMMPLKDDGTLERWFLLCSAHSFHSIMISLLVGAGATALICSSGATTGIIITLASAGIIKNLGDAIPLLLGCNLGTCTTALVASIPATQAAKKAALAHLLFNVVGAIIVLCTFHLWVWLVPLTATQIARQVANAHTIFKVVECLIFLPFLPLVVKMLNKIWAEKTETIVDLLKHRTFNKSEFLNKQNLNHPDLAILSTHKEIQVMVEIVSKMMSIVQQALLEGKEEKLIKISKYEEIVDNIKKDIRDYITLLSQRQVSNKQSVELTIILEGASELERIADHIESMVHFVHLTKERIMILDNNNKSKVEHITKQCIELLGLIVDGVKENSHEKIAKINSLVKQMEKDIRESRDYYTDCLRSGSWNLFSDLSFMELLAIIEKFSRHCRGFSTKYLKVLWLFSTKRYKFVEKAEPEGKLHEV